MIVSLYYFQNYLNCNLECKHGQHKTTFRARKDIGTSEKRPPEQLFFPRFGTYLLLTLITHFDMVVVFMYFFCVFKETSQCGTRNNGCQHKCTNGVCSCNSGYYLASNKKNCIAKDCNMPNPSYCAPGQ